jgi:uncharacterized membrane protein YdjX (TVP38/TMEM64 family)
VSPAADERRSAPRPLVLWVAGLAAVGALLSLLPRDALGLGEIVSAAGIWAPLLFLALQASRGLTWLPGNVLTPMGGYLFGAWEGALLSWLGIETASLLGYAVGRWLPGRGRLRERLARRLPGLLVRLEEGGWKGVLLARLVPGVPINAVSYAAGTLGVRPLPYLLASAAGVLPRLVVQTLIGAGAAALGG